MAKEGGAAAGTDAATLIGELDSLVKDPKSTADFSEEAEKVLVTAQSLNDAGRVQDAISLLEPLEKKARNAYDGSTATRICLWMLKSLLNGQDYEGARDLLATLTKKRGQLKRVVVDLVTEAMASLDKMPNETQVYSMIETLCAITEGKIFVEVERARVIMRLAKMKEAEGNLTEAAALLQEVQIETSIAMEKHEKTDYILEQLRLVLAKKDYIRSQIVAKSINRRLLDTDGFHMAKLRFYSYMVEYHLHQGEVMEVCLCLKACLETPVVRSSPEKIDMSQLKPFLPEGVSGGQSLARWYLEGVVLFCLLAPQTPEQIDLTLRINENEKKLLRGSPNFQAMLESFLTQDIIRYPPTYLQQLSTHPLLQDQPFPDPQSRAKLIKERIIQHNLKVVATYYKRCRMGRMAELFEISKEETEEELCELVSSGLVKAKINRPIERVDFGGEKGQGDKMVEWSRSVTRILDVLEEAGHLLEKEKLVQAALAKRKHF